MEILDQRLLDDRQVVRAPHQRGDRGQPGPARSPPPTLAGNQLVPGSGFGWPHQHRLQDAELMDAGCELRERLLVEVHSWLMPIGCDVGDRNVDQDRRLVAPRGYRLAGWNQGAETFAESTTPRHSAPPELHRGKRRRPEIAGRR